MERNESKVGKAESKREKDGREEAGKNLTGINCRGSIEVLGGRVLFFLLSNSGGGVEGRGGFTTSKGEGRIIEMWKREREKKLETTEKREMWKEKGEERRRGEGQG